LVFSLKIGIAEHGFMRYYDEKSLFDFSNGGFSNATGNFTQVVWKSSTRVGCGISCDGKFCFGTCSYSPAGNHQGKFRDNVEREQLQIYEIVL
jgi:hypothetical protein